MESFGLSIAQSRKILPFIALLVVAVICLLALHNNLCGIFNSTFPPKACGQLNLSEEERLFDFYSVYDTLVSSMSTLDGFAQRYGVDFRAKKTYYETMVRAADDDYMFFLTMCGILQDVPSFHTDVITPGALSSLRCYGTDRLLANRNLLAKNEYWKRLDADLAQSQEYNFFVLRYVDGVYIVDPQHSAIAMSELTQEPYEVAKINGVSVREYLGKRISLYNYHYDASHNVPFKSYLVFNDCEGEPATVELTNAEGISVIRNVYYSLRAENTFSNRYATAEDADIQIYETDTVSYIKVPDMVNAHGNTVLSLLNKLDNDSVLLDLRGNYGGNSNFAETYIYPSLFSGNITTSSEWSFPISKTNDIIYKNLFNRLYLHLRRDSDSKLYYGTSEHSYYSQRSASKRVFILIDARTGSAADRFVCDMKAHKKAVVLGENSGGEGLMKSYMAVEMPCSGLVYIFMPSEAKNPNGDSNSVFGTAPDIYVRQSAKDMWDSFHKGTDIEASSGYPAEFQYDTAWKYAMNILESDDAVKATGKQ